MFLSADQKWPGEPTAAVKSSGGKKNLLCKTNNILHIWTEVCWLHPLIFHIESAGLWAGTCSKVQTGSWGGLGEDKTIDQ